MLKIIVRTLITIVTGILIPVIYSALQVSAGDTTTWIAAGSITSKNIFCVWGIKNNDVYAAGESGTILHYDGIDWSPLSNNNVTADLFSLWVYSSKNVFIAGESGTILYYDGSSWSSMASGTSKDLHGIWGIDRNSIFAVGDSGTILYYDGSGWNSMTSGVTGDLQCVWGTDDNDVFAVGNTGIILHFNGNTWTSQSSGVTGNIYGIHGVDDGEIFAVGTSGIILRYRDGAWDSMSSGTKNDLFCVWAAGSKDIFAAGELGTIVHFDGLNWVNMSNNSRRDLHGIWGLSSVNAFAVGESGTVLRYIPPIIDSLSDNTGAQGATLNITITGTNLKEVTEVKFGAGIAVNSITVVNSREIGVNLTIVPDAVIGVRDVSVTTPSGSYTLPGSFKIISSPPLLTTIMPEQDRQGTTLNITIVGKNLSGVTGVWLGEGISVNSFNVLSSSQISANITIAADANVGIRDITVYTTGGSNTLSYGFTVIPALPIINSIIPAQGNQSSEMVITLNGGNFNAASDINLGSGIEVKSFYVVSSNQIIVNINIVDGAEIGMRPVSVTTPGGIFVLPDGFGVIQALPEISSVNPAEGSQGATLNIDIYGSSFNGVKEVRFGSGIAVNSFVVFSPEHIQTEVTILAGAVTGTRDVTVTTPGGSTSFPGGFVVKQGLPAVVSINPKEGGKGESLKVIISGNNLDGAILVDFGPGITVQSFSNLSQTQLSVNLVIEDSSSAGLRNVSVTTPGGTSTMANSFNVKEKSLGTLILALIWTGIALIIALFVIVVRFLRKQRAIIP